MVDALEQLRMMSHRFRFTLSVPQLQLESFLPSSEAPIDQALPTLSHVEFGNTSEPIFLDRPFDSQGVEEARAQLVASHRSSQHGGQ